MLENQKTMLPFLLASKIVEILKKKHGRDHPAVVFDNTFTSEELSLIKELDFKDPLLRSLEGIELLPNLERLSIAGTHVSCYYDSVPSISDKDIFSIQKCKNLKYLSIENQNGFSFLDLSQLKKINVLEICNNDGLEEIWGIDKLSELNKLRCFGNESMRSFENLDKWMISQKALDCDLDVNLFLQAIAYDTENGTYNRDLILKLEDELSRKSIDIRWVQSRGYFVKPIILTYNQMLQLHNCACKIISQIIPPRVSVQDKVIAIETYLAKNVAYDMDATKRKDRVSVQKNSCVGPQYGINGAYNCLVLNQCVCEGYTRGEQYLLALCGIPSRNVSCMVKCSELRLGMSLNSKSNYHYHFFETEKEARYHSIIRIDHLDCFGYSDPCWNAFFWQKKDDKRMPFSLLTKEEMIQTGHALSFDERCVGDNNLKTARDSIQYSIKRNSLFLERGTNEKDILSARRILGYIQQNIKEAGNSGR